MSFRLLSLYYGHDANLCLLEDGRPALVLEKERFTRVKHDQGHLNEILPLVLREYGWTPASIDLVVINPYCRATRGGQEFKWDLRGPTYLQDPDYNRPGWSGPPEKRISRHEVRLLGRSYDCVAVDHHLAHAAGALFTSPFHEAGILSADGGGDERYCALAYGRGGRIEWLEYDWGLDRAADFSLLNIGSTWASIGEYNFGFQRLEGAGKLMGLSSYAAPDPVLVEHVRRHALYYWFYPFPAMLFGQPLGLDPKAGFAQKLAAALQEYTRGMYLSAAERLSKLMDTGHLCLTGGCSMNCLANTAVHLSGLFQDTYVPAQPHDGGLALGQALFVWHHLLGHQRALGSWSPYLGTAIAGPEPLEAVDEIVQALLENKTVGLAYGQAESGPRALGHRTILADPRRPDIKDHLNNHVKHREWFRPYAPVVLCEHYHEWFEENVPSRYMSYMATVRPDKRGQVPGVTHVDGTARPQVLEPGHDRLFRAVLERWREETGVPILLNTSFNCQEPLVDTEEQALATWRRTGLDVLVTPSGIRYKSAPGRTVRGKVQTAAAVTPAQVAAGLAGS
ncbi:MAG: carbamoyltransferase C-terminal domain-containing protein [Thermodesulfobacteriota bacterium]